MSAQLGSSIATFDLALASQGLFDGFAQVLVATHCTRVYADALSLRVSKADGQANTPGDGEISVSGYLEPR
jgi:hypothetical protein